MNIFSLISDIKNFFSNTLNTICLLMLFFALLILSVEIKIEKDINMLSKAIIQNSQNICEEIKTNREKLNFRYFNLTKSLEEIHGVKIDTKNGRKEH